MKTRFLKEKGVGLGLCTVNMIFKNILKGVWTLTWSYFEILKFFWKGIKETNLGEF